MPTVELLMQASGRASSGGTTRPSSVWRYSVTKSKWTAGETGQHPGGSFSSCEMPSRFADRSRARPHLGEDVGKLLGIVDAVEVLVAVTIVAVGEHGVARRHVEDVRVALGDAARRRQDPVAVSGRRNARRPHT